MRAYWVDNLRHTVRFAAAVRAALEDGYRVFAELAPHPLLTRAVEQTAQSLDMPIAALAAMRREQAAAARAARLPDRSAQRGRRGGLLAAVSRWAAGRRAAAGLDPPSAAPDRDGRDHQAPGASTVAVHPLLGPHVRLREEPERHAWQAEVGTTALPWLADHQVHEVAAFPGAAYCEMALAAAHATFGEASEVRDVRFEQMLLLDDETPVAAAASVQAPGVVNFEVETDHDGERTRRASAVLHAADDEHQPPAQRHGRAAGGASAPRGRDRAAAVVRRRVASSSARPSPVWPPRTPPKGTPCWPRSGCPVRSARSRAPYGMHPALLDACFQSVAAHPAIQGARNGGLMLPLGVRRLRAYGPTRNARYCYARVTAAEPAGAEADLDVLDEHGTVLLSVRGLQMGSGVSESTDRDRVLGERLLTIDWQQRALPEMAGADAGRWLLISASDAAGLLATRLTDALKSHGAECTAMSWPQHADHSANAELLQVSSWYRRIHRSWSSSRAYATATPMSSV